MRRKIKKEAIRPVFDARAAGASCGTCPCNAHGCLPVKPEGGQGKLFVLQDMPTQYEEKLGKAVPSAASKLLTRTLAQVGASEVCYSWATACRMPKEFTDAQRKQAVESCKGRVENELSALRNSIEDGGSVHIWNLSLGRWAFLQLSGRPDPTPYLGSPVSIDAGFSVIPVQEPGYILSKPGTRFAGRWTKYLERAASFSNGSLGQFVWPESVVDEGPQMSESLQRIAERAEARGEVSVDIETRGLGLDSDISCIGFSIDSVSACLQLPPSIDNNSLVRRILNSGIMVGQNLSAFDRQVLKRAGYELTSSYEDTLLAASILDPQLPKNLGSLVGAEFHATAHKAEFKADKETGVLSGMWDSTDPEVERDRRIYCLRDAYITLLVWQAQKLRLSMYGPKDV